MRLRPIALGLAVLLAAATGAAAADPPAGAADLSAYRTYAWVERKSAADRPVVLDRVKAALEKALAARGYARAPDPDLTVVFSVGARDRVEAGPGDIAVIQTPTGPMILGKHDTQKLVSEGTLTVQMFDARTKRPVYRAQATQPLSPRGADAKVIDRAVAEALAQLPARR